MSASTFTPTVLAPAKKLYKKTTAPILQLGHMLMFFGRAVVGIPVAVRHYRSEFVRLLSDIAWGNGSLVVGGGTAGVAVVLGITVGALVGIEGYNFLDLLGLGPATGIISSLVNTRELAPIAASLAFATQAGCRFTAQLGSMRIAEEIDALEAIAIRPLPYLVTTRMCAAVLAIIPLYSVSLAANYLACQFMFMLQSGQGEGTYLYYFNQFLVSWDMLFSFFKVIVFVLLTTFIQCYYGYFASGGPEGVGVAAGHAIRLAIIVIVFANLVMTLVFWGTSPGIKISG